jgi:hypothetical protein
MDEAVVAIMTIIGLQTYTHRLRKENDVFYDEIAKEVEQALRTLIEAKIDDIKERVRNKESSKYDKYLK